MHTLYKQAIQRLVYINNHFTGKEYFNYICQSLSEIGGINQTAIVKINDDDQYVVSAFENGKWVEELSPNQNLNRIAILDPNQKEVGYLFVSSYKTDGFEEVIELYASSISIQLRTDNKLDALLKSEIQIRNEELVKARDELETFFYRASHDIREPITALQGVFKLMNARKEFQKDPILPLLEKQILRLKNFNESLVNVGAIKSRILDPSQIHVRSFVDGMVASTKTNEPIQFFNTVNQDYKIIKDTFLFECIIGEIVKNCLKYYDREKDESWVKISLENHNLIIEDNGSGINEQLSNNLFSMFFRASSSSGTGLGLYKAKMAAKKLFFDLKIESQEGKGTKAILSMKIHNTL